MDEISKRFEEAYESYDGTISFEEHLYHCGLINKEDYLAHIGTETSGRYPKGSGENPFQHINDLQSRIEQLKREGLTSEQTDKIFGPNSRKVRARVSLLGEKVKKEQNELIYKMRNEGLKFDEISKLFGITSNTASSRYKNYKNFLEKPDDINNVSKKIKSLDLAENLKKIVDEKDFIDVGKGVEKQLGVSEERLGTALEALQEEGYEVYANVQIEQVTNKGRFTTYKVLASPGKTYNEACQPGNIKTLSDYTSRDDGTTFEPSFVYPASLDSKRLQVRYRDEGGLERDGLVEIRRGCKDLSLGNENYSQVRILVDGTHYIKGMAVYSDDLPPGVDIRVNSNKTPEKAPNKLDALKPIDKNIEKDPDNPFGSAIKENGGQSYYDDPNGTHIDPITGRKQSLSLINKRSSEGDWNEWSDTLASQFLSKQPIQLINRQLNQTMQEKRDELKELQSLTNPTIRKKMLNDFAEGCDKASINLKAAALPGQKYNVILPMNSLSDNEMYAPKYENGTQIALIRYPHAGRFEIPILVVNNNNAEGRKMIGTQPKDAVGINARNAEILSGADFDGDTVMCIPISQEINIQNTKPLKQLVGFDTKLEYGPDTKYKDETGNEHYLRNGVEYKKMTNTQMEMGRISNLISDMTLKDATNDELARAVKHSMVVIDAEKHHLDYTASEKENNIENLRAKYQTHIDPIDGTLRTGGASTLISMAKGKVTVNERKEGAFFSKDTNKELMVVDEKKQIYKDPDNGKIYKKSDVHTVYVNPETGEKMYHDTNRKYYKVKYKDENGKRQEVSAWINKNGEIEYYKLDSNGKSDKTRKYTATDDDKIKEYIATTDITNMEYVKDAKQLSSGTVQENVYANYANFMKNLANEARKEAVFTTEIKRSPVAAKEYTEEVDSLTAKYETSLLNAPKERAAQIIATTEVRAKKQSYEEDGKTWDSETEKKCRQTAIANARRLVGAKRTPVIITEKEYEAIQAGAFAKDKLSRILDACDDESLKKLATPRESRKITDSEITRAKSQLNRGYTLAEVARNLGVQVSTLQKNLE